MQNHTLYDNKSKNIGLYVFYDTWHGGEEFFKFENQYLGMVGIVLLFLKEYSPLALHGTSPP